MEKKTLKKYLFAAILSGILGVILSLFFSGNYSSVAIKYVLILTIVIILSLFFIVFKSDVKIDNEFQKQIRLEIYAYTQKFQVFLFLIFIIALNLFTWNFGAASLLIFYFLANNLLLLIVTAIIKRKYK